MKKNSLPEYLHSLNVAEDDIDLINEFVKQNYTKKKAKQNFDFADKLIGLFAELYKEYRKGADYDVVFKGKDRLAVMQLLRVYKEKNPLSDSEKTIEDFKFFFQASLSIDDKYVYNNVTLTYIASNINKIKQLFNNGKNRKSNTESNLRGISEALYEHFNKPGKQ